MQQIGPPLFLSEEGKQRFRYANKTSQVIQVLKAVRIVSGLNAVVLLIRAGYVQEAGVVLRTIHDFLLEISFLDEAHYEGVLESHRKFIDDFFTQDMPSATEIMKGTPGKSRVTRKQLRASESRLLGKYDNPEMVRRRLEAVADSLDGYVHGGYPHIMELYEGQTHGVGEGFRMRGMANTPRQDVFGHWLAMFLHSALNFVAKLLQDVRDLDGVERLKDIRNRLELSEEYPGQRARKRMAESGA